MRDNRIRLITVHEQSSFVSTLSFYYCLCLVFGVVFEPPEGGEGKTQVQIAFLAVKSLKCS